MLIALMALRGESSLDRKMPRAKNLVCMEESVRGILNKETRRKPLAIAADALSYGD